MNKVKKVAGNQGEMDSQNPAVIMPQATGTLLPDSGCGHPLPPQDTDGIAVGGVYPMLSFAFTLLVIGSGACGQPRVGRACAVGSASASGLRDSELL